MTWTDNKAIILMMVAASVLAVLFMMIRVTIGAKDTAGGVIAMFAKALASIAFIMIGVMSIYNGVVNEKAAIFVLFGLVMGLVGDILLDLKLIYAGSKEEGIYLTGGMVSFGLGHILYFVAVIILLGNSVVTGSLIGICVAISVVLAALIIVVGKYVLKFNFGKFIVHSIIYAFMLIFMGALTIACCIAMKDTKMLQFAIGMILFFLSDIVLTQMYFGGKATDKVLCVVNHTLYYAAQICIAAFICLM